MVNISNLEGICLSPVMAMVETMDMRTQDPLLDLQDLTLMTTDSPTFQVLTLAVHDPLLLLALCLR